MKITLILFQAGCTVMCRRTEPVLTYVDVVWADVDLSRAPVCALVDCLPETVLSLDYNQIWNYYHSRLPPLQLIV